MATTGTEIISQVREIMKDAAGSPFTERYTDAFLLECINFGQLELVGLKHDASTATEPMELVAGTKQTLPTGAVAFLRLSRNLGTDGATPGRTITSITKADMDSSDPYWHQAVDMGEVIHYIFEDVDENNFYVYPATVGHVEIVYSRAPTKLAALTENIDLNDVYAPALVYYVCFKCFSVDFDDMTMLGKGKEFYTLFANAIGAKLQNELTISPNSAPQ